MALVFSMTTGEEIKPAPGVDLAAWQGLLDCIDTLAGRALQRSKERDAALDRVRELELALALLTPAGRC